MKAQVKPYHGTPTVFLDDQPTFFGCHLMGYMSQEDLRITTPVIKEYAKAGIHIYSIDATTTEWCGPRPGNSEPYDFSPVVPRLQSIIAADPDALFLFRMGFETRNLVDNWWNKMYPDELEVLSDGKKISQSFASTLWLSQVKDYLKAYVAYLRATGMYDRVIAYQLGTGLTTEWVKSWSSMEKICGDYSQPMRRHFQSWLKRQIPR